MLEVFRFATDIKNLQQSPTASVTLTIWMLFFVLVNVTQQKALIYRKLDLFMYAYFPIRTSRCFDLFSGISDIFQAIYPQHSFCGENHHCVLVGLPLLTTYLQTVSNTTVTYASCPERRKGNSCTMHTIHGEKEISGTSSYFYGKCSGNFIVQASPDRCYVKWSESC